MVLFSQLLSWQRQSNKKGRAFSRFADVTDSSVMRLDDLPNDRQTDARAKRLGRKKRLEDIDLERNPGTGIRYAERYRVISHRPGE